MTTARAMSSAWRLLAVVAAFVALVDLVNVLTALHDAARRGDALAPWEPITWEATSGVAEVIACPIIFAAIRRAPPGSPGWGRVLLIHATASAAFSALHVGIMTGLRMAIYGVVGLRYQMEAGAFVYEYRKDLLAYLVLGGALHAMRSGRARSAHQAVDRPAPPHPRATFDIVEASRTLRVPLQEILAIRSAGNYVEFLLADARRPLMRSTLQELSNSLSADGFLRTHRSWLVNTGRIVSLERAGSGAQVAVLDAGVRVPISRRFAAALDNLTAERTS